MTKRILALSLMANLIFGYILILRKPEKKIVERIVVQSFHDNQAPEFQEVKRVDAAIAKPGKVFTSEAEEITTDYEEERHIREEIFKKMDEARHEFLTEELGFSEEKIKKIQSEKEKFSNAASAFWEKHTMDDPSIDQRRELMDMEENFLQRQEKIFGKKNWQSYKEFRNKFNSSINANREENQPFIYMDL